MTYRLGQFSCEQCDYSEEALPETPASKGPSGPGVQRPQQWSRPAASQPDYGQAPPAPGTLYGAKPTRNLLADRNNPVQPIGAAEYMLIGCFAFFIPIVGVGFAHYWQGKGRPLGKLYRPGLGLACVECDRVDHRDDDRPKSVEHGNQAEQPDGIEINKART